MIADILASVKGTMARRISVNSPIRESFEWRETRFGIEANVGLQVKECDSR